MRRILYFLIFSSLQLGLFAQPEFKITDIDTVNSFSLNLVISHKAPLYYAENFSFDQSQKVGDTLTVTTPAVLHFSGNKDFGGAYATRNFPGSIAYGWEITRWEDSKGIHWELLHNKGRHYFTWDRDSIDSTAILDSLKVTFKEMPENSIYVFDGVEALQEKSGAAAARIMVGNLFFIAGLQDFKPMPLKFKTENKNKLMLLWQAQFGEFEAMEGDRHRTSKGVELSKYTAQLSDFMGWQFSGFKKDTAHEIINGRFVWGQPPFEETNKSPAQFLLLEQVLAHDKHLERAVNITKRDWEKSFSWFSMYAGSSFKNWSIYFKSWFDAWEKRRLDKHKSLMNKRETTSLKIYRFNGREGSIWLGGILSDTMQYTVDWIEEKPLKVEAQASKNYSFSGWKDSSLNQNFIWDGKTSLGLTPIFKAESVRNYRRVETLESKNIFNQVTHQFPNYYFYFLCVVIAFIGVIVFRA